MNRRFGGFTGQQMEAIARKNLAFDGPIDQLNTFLAANPDKAAKLQRLTQKAMDSVAGGEGYASGGYVKKKTTTTNKNKTTTGGSTAASAASSPLLTQAIQKPETLVNPVEVDPMKVNSNELINPNVAKLPTDPQGKATTVDSTATATTAPTTEANTYDATKATPGVENALDQTQAAQGTVSQNAQVEAATALPSADATVQGQLDKLMTQFEGGQTPPWAAGAKRNVDAMMAARGLGASSMAASATTQALMESATQIAIQDASTFSAFEMQNLNNRQQARLVNAQAFLQMDLANLDNRQATEMFKSQARIQSLFTDQAADNAAKQFNATSQNQTEQFFASLKTQVSQFNAAQKNATAQFNADAKNAMEMFNKDVINQRDQFEATNGLIIAQANAKWRQTVNTQNNATQNEANRQDALAATGLTETAMNALWQRERDIMAFAFTSAENSSQRAHEVVLQNKSSKDASKGALYEAAGGFVSQLVRGIF
jgi:hypothetical protein